MYLTLRSVVVLAAAATLAYAADIGVIPKKLVVVDPGASPAKPKLTFLAKDPLVSKGSGTNSNAIEVEFTLSYADRSTTGAFVLPAGVNNGWLRNDAATAQYKNRLAPSGPTQTKVAVVKPGKLLKLVAAGLGDVQPFGVWGAGDPAGSVLTAYCVTNGAEEFCHCS